MSRLDKILTEITAMAVACGWDAATDTEEPVVTFSATRGQESIEASWNDGKACTPLGLYSVSESTSTFQHTTVMRSILSGSPSPAKVRSGKAGKGAKPTKASKIPWRPDDSDDAKVDFVLGHEISWVNQFGAEMDSAVVPLMGVHTRLDEREDGAQLTFCDAQGGGYRTVRLADIASVSHKLVDDGSVLERTIKKINK